MFKNTVKIKTDDVNELYYMVDIDNLDSILKNNILSHKRAKKFNHKDISNSEVQDLREKKITRVKGGKKQITIHQHVNFYMQPHNAMMEKIEKKNLCVLRVRKEIFQRGDAVLSDRNAATNRAKFFKADAWEFTGIQAETISSLDKKGTSRYISDDEFKERKQIRQSEALFPYEVKSEFIAGIFVPNQAGENKVKEILQDNKRDDIEITVHPSLFMIGNPYKLAPFKPTTELTPEKKGKLSYSSPETSPENSDAEDKSKESDSDHNQSDMEIEEELITDNNNFDTKFNA